MGQLCLWKGYVYQTQMKAIITSKSTTTIPPTVQLFRIVDGSSQEIGLGVSQDICLYCHGAQFVCIPSFLLMAQSSRDILHIQVLQRGWMSISLCDGLTIGQLFLRHCPPLPSRSETPRKVWCTLSQALAFGNGVNIFSNAKTCKIVLKLPQRWRHIAQK